jgi:hypothetical protein
MTMTDESADSGVKVVGATATEDEDKDTSTRQMVRRGRRERSASVAPTRRAFRVVSALAIVGLLGTLVFGILYATKSSGSGQNPAVTSAAQTFLNDFFNFNAKSVDTDFSAITDMATGQFSTQAKQFFNSSIRTELEQALAESRGQIRALYVQSETPTAATVYAVIDQTYVNNKITTPQADVVRLVVNLENVGGTWKISNVTVLEGASPTSEGTASGSSGSNVPGQ